MFELLADHEPDWARIELFQVDERVALGEPPDRNPTHLEASLPPASAGSIRPMPATEPDLERRRRATPIAARAPDLVHPGLAPTAHRVAGPGRPGARGRRPAGFRHRPLPGTAPDDAHLSALAAAGGVLWLVTGADKRTALAKLLRAGDEAIPAGRVANPNPTLVCDREAAG